MDLKGKIVAVGVTGGIAVYKTCEVVSRLVKLGAQVHVVMTRNAKEFVAPLTFETLSNNRVICDMFDRDFEWEVEHISLAKKASLFLIAPATANFIGKFANGIADDFLSTTVMAAKCPILLAPAMNTNMLTSAAVQQNLDCLKKRGVKFVDSTSGRLACGDFGAGRMTEPEQIVSEIVGILNAKQDYCGKTVLITAGATQEPIDPVRYISNYSSGKMGVALARAASRRGAKVIFIVGSISESFADDFKTVRVKTTNDMLAAVMEHLPLADVIIKAAAPADYAVCERANQKIKSQNLMLQFTKNPDIAKQVGENKKNKKLIIFSAETENLYENAHKKMLAKNADMVVANDVTQAGAGFTVDTNIVTIITKNAKREYGIMQKTELAEVILDNIMELK